MVLFLILLPFGAFASLMMVTSSIVSLFVAAGIAIATVVYDLAAGRSLKMLPAGSALVFAAIAFYILLIDCHVSNPSVRFAVDAGVFAIAVVSLAVGRPFTIEYARELVDAETLQFPSFHRVNTILTLVWTGAFALMLVTNLLMIYAPTLPLWVGVAITFAARSSAAYFTRWYPRLSSDQSVAGF